ncbi:MAG: tartrate dehydrogenase [Planctomycetes bacterium]|nr:tartrate dehydrogenase [Planctomycetota bacterium]
MAYDIAFYPGDGIGPEVLAAGRAVIEAAAPGVVEFHHIAWNARLVAETGLAAPEDALDILMPFDAIYLGAVGDPGIAPDHVTLRPLLEMRRGFRQYACVRPAVLYPGVVSPLAGHVPYGINMTVVRENTEGEYSDFGGRHSVSDGEEVALQVNFFSRTGIDRVVRFAFELAGRSERRRLTSITKSNAQRHSMVFWDEVVAGVSGEFPDVNVERMLVDAAAMNFVRRPQDFDVVVASNLFGDILTDLAAVIVGGMGFAPSANINPERRYPSMFEPVHGSAPDIAGRGIANPVAAVLAGAMMMEFIGEAGAAAAIRQAVAAHLEDGSVATPDRGGSGTSAEVTEDIVRRLDV